MANMKLDQMDLMLTRLLPIVFIVTLLIPALALADEELGLRMDLPDGLGREGDPLDGNEPNDDPTGDDDVRNAYGTWSSSQSIFGRMLRSHRVVFVPQFNGSNLSFRLIILSDYRELTRQRYGK